MRIRSWARGHRGLSAGIAAVVVAAVAFGVYWFAPQNLVVDKRVDEPLPGLGEARGSSADVPTAEPPVSSGQGDGGLHEAAASPDSGAAGPVVVSRGEFRSLEHATSGSALLVQLEDGSHVVRLEGLDTSNGPDLRVLLSDRPVSDDWHGWADGRHLDLGGLKGNVGSSNYVVPGDADLGDYRAIVVWCRRFTVGFGVAPVAAQ